MPMQPKVSLVWGVFVVTQTARRTTWRTMKMANRILELGEYNMNLNYKHTKSIRVF